ncbi:AraC family transcriptional regulator [Sandaracinus amylolyticus]|uniref:AraC family transcriptional regulator n=1 Tax=Sandaracinus amylolyticus TaxID=927083 RepID=UPI001F442D86|nr:helix-turn-helix transcriptional regulator [Sandaracinus amylolyticus]
MRAAHVDVDRVTAPAFALADELSPGAGAWHAHRRHQLLFAAEGSMRLELEEGVWVLPPRRAALIRARVAHRVDVDHASSLRTIYWAPRFAPAPRADCAVFAIDVLAREMILHAMRWPPREASRDASGRRFLRVLIELAHARATNALPMHLPPPRSDELRRALSIVHARLGDPLRAAEVARGAGMSERTLARRMEVELSLGFRDYLHAARMLRAMERLAVPGTRVAEVATELGFATPSAFTHAFARFAGETPRDYSARSSATVLHTAGSPTRRKTG